MSLKSEAHNLSPAKRTTGIILPWDDTAGMLGGATYASPDILHSLRVLDVFVLSRKRE